MKNRRRLPLCRVASIPTEVGPTDPVERLVESARRSRRRGETRKAHQLLRQACSTDEWNARNFALLGAWLLEARELREAGEKLRHARWLRGREGKVGIQRSIDRLLARAALAA